VLRRLDPADRAWFSQGSHGCWVAVVVSELPCAGTRMRMRQLNPADRAKLAEAVRAYNHDMTGYSQLRSLGYMASSDVPRAGAHVRLELTEFTSDGRLAWVKASGCR